MKEQTRKLHHLRLSLETPHPTPATPKTTNSPSPPQTKKCTAKPSLSSISRARTKTSFPLSRVRSSGSPTDSYRAGSWPKIRRRANQAWYRKNTCDCYGTSRASGRALLAKWKRKPVITRLIRQALPLPHNRQLNTITTLMRMGTATVAPKRDPPSSAPSPLAPRT